MKYIISDFWYLIRDKFYRVDRGLKNNGFLVLDEVLSSKEIQRLKSDLDSAITGNRFNWVDPEKSDYRIYGWRQDALSDVDEIVENYFNMYIANKKKLKKFVLANSVVPTENNKGSGGGWHRDSVNRRQLKLMIYLSQVDENSGPFQYISGTHKVQNKLLCSLKAMNNRRFSDDDIKNNYRKDRIVSFEGKPGTMILFDSSGVHRGAPILDGKRLALTYYTFSNSIPSHINAIIEPYRTK